MSVKKILFISTFLITLLSSACSHNEEKTSEAAESRSLGKYVYVDDNNILHIDPNCSKLRNGKDDYGHDIYAKHPVDTANFMIENSESFRVCARCVSDNEYEYLLKISENNTENHSYSVAADTIARFDFDY